MSKELSFDFCIIPNPFSNGSRNMIFISKSGDNFLDKDVIESNNYKDVREILEKFGYTEISHLQFESSNNNLDIPNSSPVEMKTFLEDCGLNYSRELEVNVIRDLTKLKNEAERVARENLDLFYGNDESNEENSLITEKTKNKLIESKSELFKFNYKEPNFQDKITLYFYLFIELGFNQYSKPTIYFGGDFKNSNNHDNRNYIKIVKSDFKRVIDPKKPNSIVLNSCKTQADFIKEIGILYSGIFKYKMNIEKKDTIIIQEKKYPYKFVEIKKFLDPNQVVIVETNRMGYDKLITLSNKIKTESILESNQYILTGEIEQEAEELNQFLTKRMQVLSEQEEFEEAARMKKDVDFIREQVDYVKKLDIPQITTEEYFKLFSALNS